MSQLEDMIRTAISDTAGRVNQQDLRSLRLAPPPGRRRVVAGRARGNWLAPVLAGVAVFAIVVAYAVLTSLPRSHRPGGSTHPVAIGNVPAYYLAATGRIDPPYSFVPRSAGIYATATGARLARLVLPGGRSYVAAASAAADDRTFLYAVVNDSLRLTNPLFYIARFDPATRKLTEHAIGAPLPSPADLDGVALSPDATKVAYAYRWGTFRKYFGISVYDLKTRAIHTWTYFERSGNTEGFGNLQGYPLTLSWASDGVTLAFNWFGLVPGHDGMQLVDSGLRLIDTASPGIKLLADSRVAVRYELTELKIGLGRAYIPATAAGYLSGVAVLTPNGRTVTAGLRPLGTVRSGELASFSAASGKVERLWDRRSMVAYDQPGGSMQVLWTSSDGRKLVVMNPPGHPGRLGILDGRRVVLLPRPAKIVLPIAAW